jgi:hypothetical protein
VNKRDLLLFQPKSGAIVPLLTLSSDGSESSAKKSFKSEGVIFCSSFYPTFRDHNYSFFTTGMNGRIILYIFVTFFSKKVCESGGALVYSAITEKTSTY